MEQVAQRRTWVSETNWMISLLEVDVGDAKIQWVKGQESQDHVSHLRNTCIRGAAPRDEVLRGHFPMKTLAEDDW